jgi:hypothetical protein
MKYILTEAQFSTLMEQEELCLPDFEQTVNGTLEGIVELTPDEIYSAYESPMELANEVSDPKIKQLFGKMLSNVDAMSYDGLKAELKKLISLKNTLKEQQTPYLEQNIEIAGVQVPKAAVHVVLGLVIISVLSKLINMIGQRMDSVKSPRRRGGRSSVIGCQAARGRAQAVRRRRRRENWRAFLRKMGLK